MMKLVIIRKPLSGVILQIQCKKLLGKMSIFYFVVKVFILSISIPLCLFSDLFICND